MAPRTRPVDPDHLPEPPAELRIVDPLTLKALADPLRVRMLEEMGTRLRHGWTVKELAGRLGTNVTSLYHHVNLLERHGIIRVASTARISGISLRYYQLAAQDIRVEAPALADGGSEAQAAVDVLIGDLRGELLRSVAAHGRDRAARVNVMRDMVRLDPAQAERLTEQFEELIREATALASPDATPHRVLATVFPLTGRARAPRRRP